MSENISPNSIDPSKWTLYDKVLYGGLGYGAFCLPTDFFKVIINHYNLSDYFKNSNQIYIKKYLYFDFYNQNKVVSVPLYGFIGGLNSIFFKLINPYLVFFF